MVPNHRESKIIDELTDMIADLDSVLKALQHYCKTLADTRAVLDEVINLHPDTAKRLYESAAIVLHPKFERAIAKLQSGKHGDLTKE